VTAVPRYIGLDLHKAHVVGCELRLDAGPGQQERHFRCPTTADGRSEVFTHLGDDCMVAIEATGNAFEVYDLPLPHAQSVLVANPLEMKRLGSGKHTDKVDSARLAKMLALETLPTVWAPPAPEREVRRLLSARERRTSMRTAAINQGKAVRRRHAIAVGTLRHGPDLRAIARALCG
jgi:transposase